MKVDINTPFRFREGQRRKGKPLARTVPLFNNLFGLEWFLFKKGPMNPEAKLKSLPIIHATMIMGVMAFLVISWFLNQDKKLVVDWQQPFFLGALGYGLIGAIAAFIIPGVIVKGKLLRMVGTKEGIASKFADLVVSSHIIKLALLEGSALLSTLVFFLNANLAALYLGVFFLALMTAIFPFPGKAVEKMQSMEELYRVFSQEGPN